jgi:TolB protein
VQNLRRFTLDDRGSEDPTWTPDGGSVVFFSARGGKPGLYIQMVDSTVARALVLQSEDPRPFRVSPEGKYILHKSNPVGGGQASLTRVPLAGGASEVVGKMEGWTGFDCPSIPSAPCVSSETREGKVVFSTFDPVTGSGRVIASIDARNPTRRQWDLSPDGSQIAVSDGEEGTVTILRLSDGVRRTLRTEKMDNSGAFWTSSSDAFLVSGTGSKGMLLRMDMEGKSRVVLEWTDTFRMGFTPSPDGRHLAYLVGTLNSNVWLLENF